MPVLPYLADSVFITSSTGSRLVGVLLHDHWIEGIHVVPGLGLRLGRHGDVDLVADGGEEIEFARSTLFFSAQASTSFFIATSPVGTQWSQSARLQFAGGAGGADVHQRQRGSGGAEPEGPATRDSTFVAHRRTLPAAAPWAGRP